MNPKTLLQLLLKVSIVSLISSILIFVVIEISIAYGILPDMRPVIPFVDDPIIKHRVDPSYPDVDEDGWRNQIALDTVDIVAIGDSQTYGISALRHQAYPQQLAQQTSLDVYNMAVGGYGPVEYAYLFDTAIEKQPHTIIVGLYLGNDIYDCQLTAQLPYWQEALEDQNLNLAPIPYDPDSYIISQDGEVTGIRPFSEDFTITEGRTLDDASDNNNGFKSLLNSSRTASFLWYGYVRPIVIPQSAQFSEIVKATEQAESENGYLQATVAYEDDNIMITLTPYRRWIPLNWESEAVRTGYEICTNRLESIQNRCVANSIRCLFLMIPTKEMAYYPYLRSNGFELSGYFKLQIQMENDMRERFENFFDSIDAEMLDLSTTMQEASSNFAIEKQITYPFHYDSHPNAKGYEVIAKAIATYLDQS